MHCVFGGMLSLCPYGLGLVVYSTDWCVDLRSHRESVRVVVSVCVVGRESGKCKGLVEVFNLFLEEQSLIFTKEQVFEACRAIAPLQGFDPLLVYAICLQEGAKGKSGEFFPDRARLEQGYYLKYVEVDDLATTTEVLLAASYGVMQMMGLSLKEVGYFDFYFKQLNTGMKELLHEPMSQFAVPSAIDAYCESLNWQIEWGCKHLDRKRRAAGGDVVKMLSLWNGDSTGKYAGEVLQKLEQVKRSQ